MQFQADILGVPVIRPVVAETTALGAAYAAGLAVGFWETEDDIRTNWAESKRWEPQMDEATGRSCTRKWKKAVTKTFDWVDSDDVLDGLSPAAVARNPGPDATSVRPGAVSGQKRSVSPVENRSEGDEILGAVQYLVQHGRRQPSGEGVLLADVVAAQNGQPAAVGVGGRARRRARTPAAAGECVQPASPSARSSACQPIAPRVITTRTRRRQQLEFPIQVRRAGAQLVRGRLVGRRRAVHRRGDPQSGQRQAVADVP